MSDNKIKHCAECKKPMQYAPGIGHHCLEHGDGPTMEDAHTGDPQPGRRTVIIEVPEDGRKNPVISLLGHGRGVGSLPPGEYTFVEAPQGAPSPAPAGDQAAENGLFVFHPFGSFAICLDEANRNYGWFFRRGPEKGQWVTDHKATEDQLKGAKELALARLAQPIPASPPPESEGLDLEAIETRIRHAEHESDCQLEMPAIEAPGPRVCTCIVSDAEEMLRRLRAGAEGGKETNAR